MTDVVMTLPVYLPGNNRDWNEVPGMATIADDGEIHIKLQHKEHAQELVRLAMMQNVLYQISFDYRMTPEMIKHINERHKEKK